MTDQSARIVTDLIWNRFITILENQAQTLIRTAFSTTTRESGDLSAGLFDRRGQMVAQAVTGTPGHVNSMALAVEHFLAKYPLDTLAEGDVLLSNDPWQCSGHLHDFTVVTPVFHGGRAVGLVANTVHIVDIGGLGFGPDGREVFEEGICIPICKAADRGTVDPFLLQIIRANVREPEQVVGDLYSSMAGNEVACRAISALLSEFGMPDFEGIADAIIDRTRATVEQRIGALPDGTYTAHVRMDGYESEVLLNLTLTISGTDMLLDFAGSSPASGRGINVVMNYTTAYAVFGVNCVLNPDIPCNHGSLAPIRVTAPEGCIVNALRPSPVSARHMIGHMLPDIVLGALAPVLPVPAEGAGLIWNPSIRGRLASGRAFATVTFNAGGMGAQHDRDGWNTTAFPSGVRTMPVEAVEQTVPVLIRRKELVPDTGGPGEFRGGLGQRIEIESDSGNPILLNAMFDRTTYPAAGRNGGKSGAKGAVALASGKALRGKGLQEIPAGDRLVLLLPGGGGYGDPARRDPEKLAEDLRQGYVTPEGAERDYST